MQADHSELCFGLDASWSVPRLSESGSESALSCCLRLHEYLPGPFPVIPDRMLYILSL